MSASLARIALCALVLLAAFSATPAHAEEMPDEEAIERQWDRLGDPDFGHEIVKRSGWFFGGALGGTYLFSSRQPDGRTLGTGGYSGSGYIGAFAIEDRLSLSFLFHGLVGPRHGDAAYSILNYMGRADLHVFNFSDANHLYLVAGAGRSDIGTQPRQILPAPPPLNAFQYAGGFETSVMYGAGVTLTRYHYLQCSAEFLGLQIVSGHDKLHVVGFYLTAWFTTDAGLFGE